MKSNINKDELRLLTYLHEHAEGYTEEFWIRTEDILKTLEMDRAQLMKAASFLKGYSLVGCEFARYGTADGDLKHTTSIWLTAFGEDYMRAVESELSPAQQLTVSALKKLADKAFDVPMMLLGAFLQRRLQ